MVLFIPSVLLYHDFNSLLQCKTLTFNVPYPNCQAIFCLLLDPEDTYMQRTETLEKSTQEELIKLQHKKMKVGGDTNNRILTSKVKRLSRIGGLWNHFGKHQVSNQFARYHIQKQTEAGMRNHIPHTV